MRKGDRSQPSQDPVGLLGVALVRRRNHQDRVVVRNDEPGIGNPNDPGWLVAAWCARGKQDRVVRTHLYCQQLFSGGETDVLDPQERVDCVAD